MALNKTEIEFYVCFVELEMRSIIKLRQNLLVNICETACILCYNMHEFINTS